MRNFSFLPAAGFIVLTVSLSACNVYETVPSANANALGTIEHQQLAWGSCDPTILPDWGRQKMLDQLGSRLQCANVKIPVDWNQPSRGTASMSLLRVKASQPDKRQGAIFFNPGGPGGDGLLFGAIYGYLWNKADVATKTGASLKQLSEQYDLVGFSPRGTGDSSQLTCASNAKMSPEHYPSTDRSQRNIDAMLRNAKLVAEACQKNPFMPYINTDQTVHDLDLARKLMGDNKLNYIGYSYGTWLGSWYAKTFPEKTGRMLLDGNMDFSTNIQATFMSQSLGFERALREVAFTYASRHNDLFELGTTESQVYSVYNSFQPDLKLALQGYSDDNIIQNLYSRDSTVNIPIQLVAARGVSTLLKEHPDSTKIDDFSELLDKYIFAKNTDINKASKEIAYLLAKKYFSILNEDTSSVELNADSAVFSAITCNDSPINRDPQFWIDAGNSDAKNYPFLGGSLTENPCIYWGNPTTSLPTVPDNMSPVLMLQNEDDPATPREGAFASLKSLPNAKMIFIDNEGQHAAYPYGTECVDLPIADYFLNNKLPDNRFTACQALPLPTEDQVYPYGANYTTGTAPQSIGSNPIAGAAKEHAFGTDDNTQQLEKLLKDILKRNAIPVQH